MKTTRKRQTIFGNPPQSTRWMYKHICHLLRCARKAEAGSPKAQHWAWIMAEYTARFPVEVAAATASLK